MNEIEKRKETLPETIEKIKQAIEKIETIEEAKGLSDQAEIIRAYAKKTKMGLEIQNHAAEVKIRAERKGGEKLKIIGFGEHGGDRKSSSIVKLEDINLSKTQSHRWQSIAEIHDKEFESQIKKIVDDRMELTSASIYNFAMKLKKKKNRMKLFFRKVNIIRLSLIQIGRLTRFIGIKFRKEKI